jgi:uncharacterized membrane protein
MTELEPRLDDLAAGGEPRRPSLRVAWLASATALAAMLALSAWAWGELPAGGRVPVHFGLDGQPDHFGGRGGALLTVPLAALLVAGLLALVPRVEPRALHLASSRKAYVATWISLMALLAGVHGVLVWSALGHAVDVLRCVSLGVGAFLAVIGNYTTKLRSNWVIGIRTPWTLSSELAWTRTHRVGGRLFFLVGLATIVAALAASGGAAIVTAVAGAIGAGLFLLGYSHHVWSRDPEKQAVGR